jgi:glycosyltransferase involved in cell wall biosynthesis
MRILFILSQLEKGGGQVIQALELANFLQRTGHSVYIVSDRSRKTTRDFLDYFKELKIKLVGKKSYNYLILVKYISIFLKCNKILKTEKIDVIQVFDPVFGGLIGIILKNIHKIPVIIRLGAKYLDYYESRIIKTHRILVNTLVRKLFLFFLNMMEKITIIYSNKAIVNSSYIRKYYINKYRENSEKITLIPSGIIIKNEFEYINEVKNKLNKYILYIGRIMEAKGLEILIEAYKKVIDVNNSVELVLLGSINIDKSFFNFIKDKIVEYQLKNKIIFCGSVPHSRVYNFLKNAEVLVLPSLKMKFEEGLPNVILEAFKMGCPVVASNVGGIPELIINFDNGLLFEPSNPNDLFNKIIYIIKNPDFRSKIIKNAKEYLIKERDLNKNYKRYIEIYKKTINSLNSK